jgi:hypothetical protein
MIIFEQEKLDGLEPKLTTSASIVYASIVEPLNHNQHSINYNIPETAVASINDSDLYYIQCILVTSSWNKNDDIFDKEEVWAAKNTPEDKPTNLEHDESIIVGHITSNWPITEDGKTIDSDTSITDLPEKFHILTGSVIYKGFSDTTLRERSEKLIAEIENGTKYVSMECFFKGFDYGILNKSTGAYKVLGRNEETAYLTKYLRAYGGMGEHDEYKIGRVLRNITFTGKGFVDKPANLDSIIFTNKLIDEPVQANTTQNSDKKNSDFIFSGVSNNQSTLNVENNIMSSNEIKEEVVAEVTENAEIISTEVVATTETATTEISIELLNQKIAELETQVAAQAEIIQAAKKMKEEEEKNEVEDKKESKKEEDKEEETEAAKKVMMPKEDEDMKDEENKNLKAELDAANEVIAAYKKKEQDMAKMEKKMKRKASLVNNGLDSDTADTVIDKFETMADDAFEAMTSLFAGKMPPWLEKIKKGNEEDKKTKEKKKASENSADPSVLDTVEVVEDVNLSVGGEVESEITSTRAALVDFVSSRLGRKK